MAERRFLDGERVIRVINKSRAVRGVVNSATQENGKWYYRVVLGDSGEIDYM